MSEQVEILIAKIEVHESDGVTTPKEAYDFILSKLPEGAKVIGEPAIHTTDLGGFGFGGAPELLDPTVARVTVNYTLRPPMEDLIASSTMRIALEVEKARVKAHAKHGENSIEALSASAPGWGDILGEEGGEVAEVIVDNFRQAILSKAIGRVSHAGTYDADRAALRGELIDVASVAVAWIAAIDRELGGS